MDDRRRLELVFAAWDACPGQHRLNPGAGDDEIAEAERRLGRRLPESLKAVYRYTNGGELLGGNLMIEPLGVTEPVGEMGGLVGLSDFLRKYDWPVPDELLVFGSDGSEAQLGCWLPRAKDASEAPVIETDEAGHPLGMAVVGTTIPRFLMGWTASYVQHDETSAEKALDVLGVPAELRSWDIDYEACLRWADPDLPDPNPDPYERPLSVADMNVLFGGGEDPSDLV